MYLISVIAATALQMVLGQSFNCPNLKVDVVYEWKTLRYAIPSNYYINSSLYNKDYTFVTGIDVGPDYFLLATPNAITRSPYTISSIPKSGTKNEAPLLQPFPDISWYKTRYSGKVDCINSLFSVFEMAKDKCNRLWVADTGLIQDLSSNPQQICPPKIVVFDLATKKAVKVVPLPDSVLSSDSRIENIILDTSLSQNGYGCDNVYAYIADGRAPAIIVYNSARNSFHRITHPSMNNQPGYTTATVDGENFAIPSSILGMDLLYSGSQRRLFYQSFASVQVFSISISSLQKATVKDSSELDVRKEFTKSSQSVKLHTDRLTGCLLFNPLDDNTIVAWSNATRTQREVAYNPEHIHVIVDMEQDNVISSVLYAISTHAQNYINHNINPSKTNVRLLRLQSKS